MPFDLHKQGKKLLFFAAFPFYISCLFVILDYGNDIRILFTGILCTIFLYIVIPVSKNIADGTPLWDSYFGTIVECIFETTKYHEGLFILKHNHSKQVEEWLKNNVKKSHYIKYFNGDIMFLWKEHAILFRLSF